MKKKSAWKSRKFWVSIITAGVAVVNQVWGYELDAQVIMAIVLPVIAWILGESFIDSRK